MKNQYPADLRQRCARYGSGQRSRCGCQPFQAQRPPPWIAQETWKSLSGHPCRPVVPGDAVETVSLLRTITRHWRVCFSSHLLISYHAIGVGKRPVPTCRTTHTYAKRRGVLRKCHTVIMAARALRIFCVIYQLLATVVLVILKMLFTIVVVTQCAICVQTRPVLQHARTVRCISRKSQSVPSFSTKGPASRRCRTICWYSSSSTSS